MKRFKDRVAIITGGAGGLGKETVLRFAEEGARVVIADINFSEAEKLSDSINKKEALALPLAVDITDQSSIQGMVDEVIKHFGQIDILVNNAGIYTTCKFDEITSEIWDQMIGLNLKGLFFLTQAVVPHMKKRSGGKIVNIASTCFIEGIPQMSHYVASKGGVIGLTRSLASELGEFKINVNSISPGMILTEKFRSSRPKELVDSIIELQVFKRAGTAEDFAGPILFLCSADSDWVTGQNLVVDGGTVFN